MLKNYFIFVFLFTFSQLSAQLSLTNSGTTYTIDFDNTISGVNNGAYAANGTNIGVSSPATGQLNSNAWSVSNSSSTADPSFGGNMAAGAGTTVGGTPSSAGYYSFDIDTSSTVTNRAFGWQATGSGFNSGGNVTLRVVNNTGATITQLVVSYKVYAYNDQARANDILFKSHSSTSSWSGSAISYSNLDFTSPAAANSRWVVKTRKIILNNITIANGSNYYLRWTTADNSGSGTRDELAIDDIQITPTTNPVTYYFYKGTGALNSTANWGTATDGTGTAPTDFTSNNQVFVVTNTSAVSTSAGNWTVSGTNSKVIIGHAGNSTKTTVTITSGNTITATVDLNAEGKLLLQDATIPTLGTLNCKGTRVDFNASTSQIIPAANYGDLQSSGTGDRVLASSGNITISGDFTITGSGLFTVTGSTVVFAAATDSVGIPVPSVASGNNYNNIQFTGAGYAGTSGAFSAASLTLSSIAPYVRLILNNSATGKTYSLGNLTLTSGIFDGGNVDSTGSYTSVINISGDFSMAAGAWVTNSAPNDLNLFNFNGSTTQNYTRTGNPNFQYTNIMVSAGATLNCGTSIIPTVSGEGTRTIFIVGTLQTSNSSGFSGGSSTTIPSTSPARTVVLGTGCTIEYSSASAQTITSRTYEKLKFSGAGTKTLSSSAATITDIEITAGTVTVGTNTFGGASTNLTMSGGRFIVGGTGTKPDANGTYNLTGGVIEFTNTSATGQTIRSPKTYYSIEVTGSEVSGSSGNYTLVNNGSFTVNSGGIFSVTTQRIVGATGTSVVINGTFKTSDADGFYGDNSTSVDANNTVSFGTSGTVTYNRSGDQVVSSGVSYQNLTLTGSGNKTLNGALDVNGNFIDSAGTFITSDNNMTLAGNWTMISGAGFTPGLGTVTLDGASSSQTLTGTTTFNNLTLSNSNGATITTGASNTMNINGIYTHTLGTLTTNGNLVLKATGATSYAQIAGTGTGTISGNITAEYLITGGGIGWRPVCSPLNGATLAQLSDDVTLNFGTPETSYANIYYFNEAVAPYWNIPSGTGESMNSRVYSIYMGGTSAWANPLPLTLDITGTYNGTSNYNVSSLTLNTGMADTSGWQYVRNPWASGFTWDGTAGNVTIGAGGVQGQQVWVYDQSGGAYVSFDNSTPGVIPPFTPFTFQVTANNSEVTFLNTGRTTSTTANYFDKTGFDNFIEINVTDAAGKTDKVKWYTDENAANNYDIHDGNKKMNPVAPNLYFVIDNSKANKGVWNTVPATKDEVQLNFEAITNGNYTMDFSSENVETGVIVYLKDKKTGQLHPIADGPYTFGYNTADAKERFSLVFGTQTTTAVAEAETPKAVISCYDNILVVSGIFNQPATIEVYDLLGRNVAVVNEAGNSNGVFTQELNTLPQGYYLVRVINGGQLQTAKILVE